MVCAFLRDESAMDRIADALHGGVGDRCWLLPQREPNLHGVGGARRGYIGT